MTSLSYAGNEKLIDDPVLIDGKFVRNVGCPPTPAMYKFVYLKDGDKDLLKRMGLSIRIGAAFGVTVGVFHLASFGRNPKWPTKLDPFVRLGFSCMNGILAMMLHSGTVSLSSQIFGGKDLLFNWAAGGFVAGSFVYKVVHKTPQRLTYVGKLPLIFAAAGALVKSATIYDKPLDGVPRSTYGVQPIARNMGPRHYDTMNRYRRQEEHYLEKYL